VETVLILADGVWEGDAQARDLAAAANFVIAADGAYAQAMRAGARVDLVVGDFDSLSESALETLGRDGTPVQRYPKAKDESDVELALDEAIRRRPRCVTIFGGLGGRLDHALSNVHLLERGREAGVDVRLVDGAQSVTLAWRRHSLLEAETGDRVSLLPLSESASVTTEGLRYPLHGDALVRASSRGVSNEVTSVPVVVDVARGVVLVIHVRQGEHDEATTS